MGGADRLGKSVVRPHAAAVAVVGLALLCVGIVVSGSRLKEQAPAIEIDDVAEIDVPPAEEPQEAAEVDPDTGLERIAPRAPLSDLATPQPPKPPKATPPERWRPTRLFNPVATAAGMVEAQGHRVALAGIEPVGPDEKCSYDGREWPCGAQARTAFRSWLRARALSCKVPPEPDREIISAECRVGNEDPAQWLTDNGWARAVANGPYADAMRGAEDGRRGVFGAPPKRTGITVNPAAPPAETPAVDPLEPAEPVPPSEGFPPAPPTPPASPPAPSQ